MSRKRWNEIRDLWCEWDPIGVVSLGDWPRDEYDAYLGPTLRMLESSESIEKIIAYLAYVELEHMGLSETAQALAKRQEFATKLKQWHSNNWQNTVS